MLRFRLHFADIDPIHRLKRPNVIPLVSTVSPVLGQPAAGVDNHPVFVFANRPFFFLNHVLSGSIRPGGTGGNPLPDVCGFSFCQSVIFSSDGRKSISA